MRAIAVAACLFALGVLAAPASWGGVDVDSFTSLPVSFPEFFTFYRLALSGSCAQVFEDLSASCWSFDWSVAW